MENFNPKKYRDDQIMICQYLNEALDTNDLAQIVSAIGDLVRAQNVLSFSKETGLGREGLYRIVGGHNPALLTVLKILYGFRVKIEVKPIESPDPKKPRPPLGRPRSAVKKRVLAPRA